ncbi:hypothetical protein DSL72_007371 [Monilinia vaccinii-corymbosi]|uniref:Uncharacterized protein n=1 Tax=Monilinia vaccinii-corymbosi TaxID=61207 RepID=A0A8A3PMS2_9HELO|nr:hypothetical protein DSL72_007371 [Monilinia vaccinii-corymbosi]
MVRDLAKLQTDLQD